MEHMYSPDTVVALPALIEERLGADDEPGLWVEILRSVAEDASVLRAQGGSRLFAILGCCSHWARPHQSRWTAAGGFALPEGYGDGEGFLGGLPNLDWSVTLQFNPNQPGWDYPMQPPTKRFSSVRLAIPSRTLATPHGPRFSVFGEGGGQKYSRPALNPSAPARYFASIL